MNLVEKSAAIMIKDTDAKTLLINQAIALKNDTNLQKNLSENISKLGKPLAAKEIANEVFKIIGN